MIIREMFVSDLDNGLLDTLASLSPVGIDRKQARKIAFSRKRDGVVTFVATIFTGVVETVIGTLSLLIEHKFIRGGGKVGHIEDVAVHRNYKGGGVGRALMERAIGHCQDVGCYKIVLDCSEENVPFYSKFDFHRHEVGMRLDISGTS
jgi:glucosamine-phosphate N-acetyltransferase